MRHISVTTLALCLVMAFLASCGGKEKNAGENAEGKNIMTRARLLRYYERDGYDEAEIRDYNDTSRVLSRYILLDRKAAVPAGIPKDAQVLRVPLANALVFSTVHMAAMEELGADKAIGGVVDAEYIISPSIKKLVESGKVTDAGSSMNPTVEKVMAMQPDAIMLSVYEGMDVKNIDRLGFPIISMTDQQEDSPLARAEWLRFIGRLTGHKAEADSIFKAVERDYVAARLKASDLKKRPKLLTETMYEGVWYVPGGKSYQAAMIRDAGGDYPWANTPDTGSLALTLEEVLEKGGEADIWLVRHFGPLSRRDMIGMDSRYANFKALDGGLWYCDTSVSPLFEETSFHPDRLLADYIVIFSGGKGKTRYFKPLDK